MDLKHRRAQADAKREMEDLGSPIAAFVRDRCVVGPQHEVVVDHLYTDWKAWCADNGRHVTSSQVFGRDLRAAYPGIKVQRPRSEDGNRYRTYQGIGRAP